MQKFPFSGRLTSMSPGALSQPEGLSTPQQDVYGPQTFSISYFCKIKSPSHTLEKILNNWMQNMFCFPSQRSSVSSVLRQHSHFFWVLRGIKGSIYSICHGASKRHEKNKQSLVGDDTWMDPATPCGWGQATKGLLYHCPVLLKAKSHCPGGRLRWIQLRAPRQSVRIRCSTSGRRSWLLPSDSVPCQLLHIVALAVGSWGYLGALLSGVKMLQWLKTNFALVMMWGGNRKKQDKMLLQQREEIEHWASYMAKVLQHPKKRIISPFHFVVL